MNAVVFEHVPVAELPQAWRDRLGPGPLVRVTVQIEAEPATLPAEAAADYTDDPLFGMWRDREDMADVAAYVRKLREPRLDAGGAPNKA
jgi:hypothetical protein